MNQIWESTEGCAHQEALSLVANRSQTKTMNLMQELPALGLNKLSPMMNEIRVSSVRCLKVSGILRHLNTLGLLRNS